MSKTCVNVRYNKKKHVILIKALAQKLDLGLILEKVKRVTEFNGYRQLHTLSKIGRLLGRPC